MAQISLYVPDSVMAELREDAERQGVSISAYTRSVLENRNNKGRLDWSNGWPPGYFDLYGSSPDFPDVPDLEPEPIESW